MGEDERGDQPPPGETGDQPPPGGDDDTFGFQQPEEVEEDPAGDQPPPG